MWRRTAVTSVINQTGLGLIEDVCGCRYIGVMRRAHTANCFIDIMLAGLGGYLAIKSHLGGEKVSD